LQQQRVAVILRKAQPNLARPDSATLASLRLGNIARRKRNASEAVFQPRAPDASDPAPALDG
jgi:hypothetical protein